LINSDLRFLYSQQREAGYRSVLGKKWQTVVYVDSLEYQAGVKAMEELFTLPEPPDAVFAISDSLAGGAMHFAHTRGLRVPKDVAVMGFDGVPFGEVTFPPLTTVQQPMHQIGVRSVQLLLERIENPSVEIVDEILDWQLVVRGSA